MKPGASCWCCCEDLRCLVPLEELAGTFVERSGEEGEVSVGRRVIVGELLAGLRGVGGPMLTLLLCGLWVSLTVRAGSSSASTSLELALATACARSRSFSFSFPLPPPTTDVTDATKRCRCGEDMLAMAEVARERVPVRAGAGMNGGSRSAESAGREGKRVARGEGVRREVDGEGGGGGEEEVDGPGSGKR